MSRSDRIIEREALLFRLEKGLTSYEPINLKSLLLKYNILTLFRPLSENFSGMCIKSQSGKMFMLVNSTQSRGRQRFTIAHELYHLYIEKNPTPHICTVGEQKNPSEKNADAFASALLMPADGIMQLIPEEELNNQNILFATVLKIEHYFVISHKAMVYRLADLNLIKKSYAQELLNLPIKDSARQYGYDINIYEPGNNGLVIGDFGAHARLLFDDGKISEGHYLELLSKISRDNESCEN